MGGEAWVCSEKSLQERALQRGNMALPVKEASGQSHKHVPYLWVKCHYRKRGTKERACAPSGLQKGPGLVCSANRRLRSQSALCCPGLRTQAPDTKSAPKPLDHEL